MLTTYYRKEMRSRILENMDDMEELSGSNLAKEINVFDVIHLFGTVWNKMAEKTI